MDSWRKLVIILLLLLQFALVLAFALLAYGHLDECRRWNRASFSENYSTRIQIEAVGCILNSVLAVVQFLSSCCVVMNLTGRRLGVMSLQLVPFVFIGATGLAIILWIVTPFAGSPHNDIARGLGYFLLIAVALLGALVASIQNVLLRSINRKP